MMATLVTLDTTQQWLPIVRGGEKTRFLFPLTLYPLCCIEVEKRQGLTFSPPLPIVRGRVSHEFGHLTSIEKNEYHRSDLDVKMLDYLQS